MSNRVRTNSGKNDVQTLQKMVPMKAIHLFEPSGGQKAFIGNNDCRSFAKLSPNKGFQYEQFCSGNRSPGAVTQQYKGEPFILKN